MSADPSKHLRDLAHKFKPGSVVWVDGSLFTKGQVLTADENTYALKVDGIKFRPFDLFNADGELII